MEPDQRAPRFSYQPPLDGLRAVAVGSVIAYHLGLTWAGGGFLGVDTFFVLSGYLITSLLLIEWRATGTIGFAAFWVRRARRLLPALLLVLAAVAIYAALEVPADRLDELRGDGLATLFYGANWRLIFSGQSYFDLFSAPSPLRHAWSLAIEEQFYIVWPLITFACLRLARGKRWALAGVCILGTGLSMVTMAALFDSGDPSRAYYGTDARAQMLLIGVALAIFLARKSRTGDERAVPPALRWAGLTGMAYMIWAFAQVGDQDAWMYRGGYALFGVAVAVVIASVVRPGGFVLRRTLSVRPVVWVGRISYGLYLWHWPVIVVVNEARTGLDGAALDLLRVAITVAASTLSFYFVEQPIRHGALRGRVALAATPAAFAAIALVIVLTTQGAAPPPTFAQQGKVVTDVAGDGPVTGGGDSAVGGDGAGEPPPPAPGSPQRVLLVGDSLAASLQPGLEEVVEGNGIAFAAAAIPGCGVAGGVTTDSAGEPFPWSTNCPETIGRAHEEALAKSDPELVVWLSSWETANRIVDGQLVKFGTTEGNRVLLSKIDEAVARLTSGGARVVFLTVALPAFPNERGVVNRDNDERLQRLNTLLRGYARDHPDRASVVELPQILCPEGPPCPPEIDGVVPRPGDGAHFEGEGPRWMAERLLPLLLAPPQAVAAPSRSQTNAGVGG